MQQNLINFKCSGPRNRALNHKIVNYPVVFSAHLAIIWLIKVLLLWRKP